MEIFISYARIDDQPLSEGQHGWICRFHRQLEVRLSQLLGEKPKIWRDVKLGGSDVLDDSIFHQLRQVKALISIVSPRYIKSEWCLREATEFITCAEQAGDLSVQKRYRLIKVMKTPVELSEIPPPLRELCPIFDSR